MYALVFHECLSFSILTTTINVTLSHDTSSPKRILQNQYAERVVLIETEVNTIASNSWPSAMIKFEILKTEVPLKVESLIKKNTE